MPTKERTPIRRGPGDEPADVKRVAAAEGVIDPTGEPIEMSDSAGPRKLEKMPFFDMLAALTPREWEDRLVYLYRSGDKNIIKADPKDNNYVERISHSFDESYVKEKHGGGQFLAILKNTRINGAERKHIFKVDGLPIVHDDEVMINRKGGAADGNGKGELTMVLQQLSDLQNRMLQMASNSSGSEKDAITKAIDTMQVGMKGALEMQQAVFKQSANSTTGNPMVDKFLESAIAKMNGNGVDPMEQLTKTLALMKQLSPEAKPSAGLLGSLGEIKGLVETMKELGFKIGGGEASEGAFDWKAALAQNIPGVLGSVTQWVNGWLQVSQERNRIMAAQIEQQRRGGAAQLPPAVQTSAPAPAFPQVGPAVQPNQPAVAATVESGSALPHNFAPSETSGNQAEVIALPATSPESGHSFAPILTVATTAATPPKC